MEELPNLKSSTEALLKSHIYGVESFQAAEILSNGNSDCYDAIAEKYNAAIIKLDDVELIVMVKITTAKHSLYVYEVDNKVGLDLLQLAKDFFADESNSIEVVNLGLEAFLSRVNSCNCYINTNLSNFGGLYAPN